MDYNEQKNVFFMLTYIVVSVTIYVMSVTMYVTSANYICYENYFCIYFQILFICKLLIFSNIYNLYKMRIFFTKTKGY